MLRAKHHRFAMPRNFATEKERLDAIIKDSVEQEMSSFMPAKRQTEEVDAVARREVRNRVKLREGSTEDTGEVSIYDDDENQPLAVRERRQTNSIQELFREKA